MQTKWKLQTCAFALLVQSNTLNEATFDISGAISAEQVHN